MSTFNLFNPMSPKKNLRKKAFTLVELLVVIVIIGILAGMAIPAVAGAITRAQMIQVLNNAKQFQLATFTVNLDFETAGLGSIWPKKGGGSGGADAPVTSTLEGYINELDLNRGDIQKMLSGPGVAITVSGEKGSLTVSGTPNIALKFYGVGDKPDDGQQVFISSYNVTAKEKSVDINADAVPFGDKGGILCRKSGSAESLTARVLKSTAIKETIPSNQAQDMGW